MSVATIDTADVRLRLERHGPSEAPVVLLVHGFPDHRGAWDPVVRRLATDHHVVSFDVRGAGGSSAPERTSGYRVRHLVDDLTAVLDEVAADRRPVHLVGHDWGSIQCWAVLAREAEDERLTGRIASFTSISGPGLELYGHFVRSGLRHGRVLTVGHQLARSWYVAAFQVPRLPEVVLSRAATRIARTLSSREGLDGADDGSHWGATFVRDAVNGINLYRANLLRVLREPATTTVPVQLVVPTKDRFVTPALFADLERFAPNLRRVEVVAGHWVPRTQPDVVADAVRAFVADLAQDEAVRAG
ncbi:alpha/beta fold hydrolase [Aeromicrobium sp. CTD01-1L150]|uniref:alpha/beta fold hydrolase n=1 Tax=Aeromicrobium sp. CTD01-1L150 TaxID=3341830 RepID=UPI0035C18C1A